MTIRVEVEGVDEASRMFDEVAEKVEDLKDRLPRVMADMVIAEARSNLQNNLSIVSGDLISSLRVLNEDVDGITVGSELPYAKYVEYGRGIVRPIKAKFLRFRSKETGEWVYAKEVGPAEPRPFFWPAVGTMLKRIKSLVSEELAKA